MPGAAGLAHGVSEHNPGSPGRDAAACRGPLGGLDGGDGALADVESEEDWDQLVSVFCEMSVATFEPLVDESHRIGQMHEPPSKSTSGQAFWDGTAFPPPAEAA
jgi:hypothetical protein